MEPEPEPEAALDQVEPEPEPEAALDQVEPESEPESEPEPEPEAGPDVYRSGVVTRLVEDVGIDFIDITGFKTCTALYDPDDPGADNVAVCVRTSKPVSVALGDTLLWPLPWLVSPALEDSYGVVTRIVERGSTELWLDHRLTVLDVVDLYRCVVWPAFGDLSGVYVSTAYRTADGLYRIVLNNSNAAGSC